MPSNQAGKCTYCLEPLGPSQACSRCKGPKVDETSSLYLPPGTVLEGRYSLARVLGYGGFGVTYLAWDEVLQLKVAIKEYLPREWSTRVVGKTAVTAFTGNAREEFRYGLDKFLEEARGLARFQSHPNIVAVQNFFQANDTGYLVMEYVEGVTLEQYLSQQGGRLSYSRALSILMPVMEALRVVHEAGVLHRDISPDNLYLTKTSQVKLLDFGAARQEAGIHSRSVRAVLKPGYTPLELYSQTGDQGPWTDVYEVAATLYRMLTGKRPPEVIDRLDQDPLVPPSQLGVSIPSSTEKALLSALAIRASDRPRNMEELQQSLVGRETSAWRAETSMPGIVPEIYSAPRTIFSKPKTSIPGARRISAPVHPERVASIPLIRKEGVTDLPHVTVWRHLGGMSVIALGAVIAVSLLWDRQGSKPIPRTPTPGHVITHVGPNPLPPADSSTVKKPAEGSPASPVVSEEEAKRLQEEADQRLLQEAAKQREEAAKRAQEEFTKRTAQEEELKRAREESTTKENKRLQESTRKRAEEQARRSELENEMAREREQGKQSSPEKTQGSAEKAEQKTPDVAQQNTSLHRIGALVGEMIGALESGNIDRITSAYADRVHYFERGLVDRNTIREDKRAYYRRWPTQTWTLDAQPQAWRDPNTGIWTVIYTTSYRVYNGQQKKGVRGQTQTTIEVRDDPSGPHVVGVKEQTLNREKFDE
ncbi:eukaryotic-like serine/threonine-protein kinase [Gammaproteobacteria bacterium]